MERRAKIWYFQLLFLHSLPLFGAGYRLQESYRPVQGQPAYTFNRTLAQLLVRHASAAYVDSPADLVAWNCSRCNGLIKGFNMSRLIVDNPKTLQAYVGVQEGQGLIVVSFRGTELHSLVNWICDLYFLELDLMYPGTKFAYVHWGFYSAYHNTSLRDGILSAVQRLQAERPGLQVAVTGHSLGAALACLCALDLTVNAMVPNVKLFTFGQPRVGNRAFALYFDEHVPDSTRMVHGNDLVPHLPPLSQARRLYSYYHTATEVWIHKLWGFGPIEVIRVCDSSGEDRSCSRSVLGDSIGDHLVYLGVVLGDSPGSRRAIDEQIAIASDGWLA